MRIYLYIKPIDLFYYSRSQGTIGDLNYFCIYWLWRSFI